jgi:hypothetical protein
VARNACGAADLARTPARDASATEATVSGNAACTRASARSAAAVFRYTSTLSASAADSGGSAMARDFDLAARASLSN